MYFYRADNNFPLLVCYPENQSDRNDVDFCTTSHRISCSFRKKRFFQFFVTTSFFYFIFFYFFEILIFATCGLNDLCVGFENNSFYIFKVLVQIFIQTIQHTYTNIWNQWSDRSGAEVASVRHWWDITISATRPIIKAYPRFEREAISYNDNAILSDLVFFFRWSEPGGFSGRVGGWSIMLLRSLSESLRKVQFVFEQDIIVSWHTVDAFRAANNIYILPIVSSHWIELLKERLHNSPSCMS